MSQGCCVVTDSERCWQDYLAAMACAANYAWVNRSTMTFLVRQAFAKQFKKSPVSLLCHLDRVRSGTMP